jgi:hypothetical protein
MRKNMLKEEIVFVDLGIEKAEKLFTRDNVIRE